MKDPIHEEQLERWLHEAAEIDAPPLPAPDALATRVRKQFRRRRIARRVAGATAVAAALLAMAGIAVLNRDTSAPSPAAQQMASASQAEVEQLRARLAALEKELAAQKARLELLANARQNPREKSAISAEALLPPEALMQIAWEQTATMVLDRAERLAAAKRNQEAAAEYRRIIEDFPSTSLVDTAKKELRQLTSNF
jgi:hypothetical protein